MPERVDKTESDDLVDAAVINRAIASGAVDARALDGSYPDGSIMSADLGFEPGTNAPNWQPEPNAPFSATNVGSLTCNLSEQTADSYYIEWWMGNASGGGTGDWYIVDGNRDRYHNFWNASETITENADRWVLQTTNYGQTCSGRGVLRRDFPGSDFTHRLTTEIDYEYNATPMVRGECDTASGSNDTEALESLEFGNDSTTELDVYVDIWSKVDR